MTGVPTSSCATFAAATCGRPASSRAAPNPTPIDVAFNEDRAEITRHDGTLTTTLEVLVSAEDDAEVRRVSIANAGDRVREIDVTSYAELVLAPQADDVAHPAFMKLFVATEYLRCPGYSAGNATATRAGRAGNLGGASGHRGWRGGGEAGGGNRPGPFPRPRPRHPLGRSRWPTAGPCPTRSARYSIRSSRCAAACASRQAPPYASPSGRWLPKPARRCSTLSTSIATATAFERAATLAWTQAQVQLHHLGIDPGEAGLFQRIAGHLLHAGPALRPSSDTILRGAGGQPGLWPMGISGDLPIVLLRIADIENLDIARQLLQAHEYWRMKQLAVDLVILNERASSYVQDLQSRARDPGSGKPVAAAGRRGADGKVASSCCAPIWFRRKPARCSRRWRGSSWSDSAARSPISSIVCRNPMKLSAPCESPRRMLPCIRPCPCRRWNSSMGLAASPKMGGNMRRSLARARRRRHPGSMSSPIPSSAFRCRRKAAASPGRSTAASTSLRRGRTIRVCDRPGEVFYLRDDDSGDLWCPTALPIRDNTATYAARHGWGYSRFEHAAHGIAAELLQYVPVGDPIKISRLTLRNTSRRTRHLSLTAYVEWVLGPSRGASAPFVTTAIDPDTGAMFARNPWHAAFGSRVAFADLAGRQTDWTGDRREFIGRNGTLENPAALAGAAPALQHGRRRSRSVRRAAKVRRAAAKRPRRDRVLPRRSRERARCQHACRAVPEG